jgi:hypothetical protein
MRSNLNERCMAEINAMVKAVHTSSVNCSTSPRAPLVPKAMPLSSITAVVERTELNVFLLEKMPDASLTLQARSAMCRFGVDQGEKRIKETLHQSRHRCLAVRWSESDR